MYLPFYPVKGSSFTLYIDNQNLAPPNLTYISKDGGTWAATTNSVSRISDTNTGTLQLVLILTSTEMNANVIMIGVSSNGSHLTSITIYTSGIIFAPQSVNVSQWNGTNVVTPDVAGEPKVTLDSTALSSVASSVTGASLSEISSVPTAGDTLANKIQAIFEYLFFKRTVTATTETLVKSDSSTTLGTATLNDDGTTFIKGKAS